MLFKIGHNGFGFVDQPNLFFRDDHVVLTERDASLKRVAETKAHDRIGKQHSVFLSSVTIDLIDHVADFLLCKQAVDGFKRNLM